MTTITIPGSKYLVFTGHGELPGVVIQTWGAVWQSFEQEARDKRAYTVDFERYDQREPSRVEIYIAVKREKLKSLDVPKNYRAWGNLVRDQLRAERYVL